MALQKKKTRMYEPWGYQDENNYQSADIIHENDLDSFFADTQYVKGDNKIYFYNKDGNKVGELNVSDFVKSDSIIEKTEYKDGILTITFTNGDVITIDLTDLLDENEFKDGLTISDHVVKVLIDGDSDDYLTVSENGVKVAGVKADIEAEKNRAEGEEQRIETKLDQEIARATSEEQRIEAKLEQEIDDRIADVDEEETRATGEEQRIEAKLDEEITRAKRIEQALNSELDSEEVAREAGDAALGVRIDNEINDRKADVNEEEARAKAAEEALQSAIDDEAARATSAETALQAAIEAEGQRAQDAEAALDEKIDAEEARAKSAETALDAKIDQEVADRKAEAVASVEYDESGKTIDFYNANNEKIDSIDASKFIKDGMVDDVKIENDNLVITFNTDSGKQDIQIPLTDIFNPNNYYDKASVDGFVNDLAAVDSIISGAVDNLFTEVENESQRAISAETDLQSAIDLKADRETTYTKEEVDALISEKEAEIVQVKKDYNNLKEIVSELGGNVEWGVPADGTFKNMMKKNGTVKLGEDITTSTYTGGITSKNETTLNLNGKNLTFSGQTTTNPGIMTRGKQEITIMGKGTFDAAGRIAVEANGADTVINLSGTTGMFGSEPTYVTDRSGGELIYCYLGTINIYAGVFKNNGDDKKFLLNCYDANYRAGTAKIIVYGGKFYDFNPADNNAEGEHTSFVPEGYHVETSTDGDSTVYTVKKD